MDVQGFLTATVAILTSSFLLACFMQGIFFRVSPKSLKIVCVFCLIRFWFQRYSADVSIRCTCCQMALRGNLYFIRDASQQHERLLVAAKLPGPPHDIKNVFRNSLIGPYRKEIVYKISVFDLLQSMESKEVFSKQATRGRGTQIMHRELII